MGRRREKGQNELVGHFGTNPILTKKKGDYTAYYDGKWGL